MPPDVLDLAPRQYSDTIQHAAECCVAQQKIQAIKALRGATNLGLKEAKDIIDQVYGSGDSSWIEQGIRRRLDDRGVPYAQGNPSQDYWERMSECLWTMADDLARAEDERADSVRWLAQEFDEIWGVS